MQSVMQMFVARFASRDPSMQSVMQMFVARFASRDPSMQSVMQMFVARFASRDPSMQSVMQMFVARFASRDPCILPGVAMPPRAKYRGLSTSAAKNVAFGRDDNFGVCLLDTEKLSSAMASA
jgi:hypothetical protein